MCDTMKGRVAIVTGAARGIGAAIAEALLQNGCKVCLTDILEQEGMHRSSALKQKYGDDHVCFRVMDVTSDGCFEGAFKETIALWGPVTILVSNAGIVDEENYARCIDVNLVSSLRAAHLALQYMGKDKGGPGGNVVFTASVLGLFPYGPIPAYSATKAAVLSLVRCFSRPQYEKSGVHFAALCPGLTDTSMGQIVTKGDSGDLADVSAVKGMEGVSTPDLIAEGAIQLLKDNRNGSVLVAHCALEGHHRYVADSHFDPTVILGSTKPAAEGRAVE